MDRGEDALSGWCDDGASMDKAEKDSKSDYLTCLVDKVVY
jgi:hypothetical protein